MIQVSRDTHLKLAFLMWALVGSGLLIAGAIFLFGNRTMSKLDPSHGAFGVAEGIGLAVALGLGFVKGNFVLPKIARKNMLRIDQLPKESPIYMTFSLKSWLLILAMILIGRTIRFFGAPRLLIGVIYVAVGFALVLGSRAYLMGPPVARVEKGVSS